MKVGDKVVCIDKNAVGISFGEIYTISGIKNSISGEKIYNVEGVSDGVYTWRFHSLEEMQNENSIQVVNE
jgi:hypothetical protein